MVRMRGPSGDQRSIWQSEHPAGGIYCCAGDGAGLSRSNVAHRQPDIVDEVAYLATFEQVFRLCYSFGK